VIEPARWGRRRAVLDVLDRLHLARPAVRAYEYALATKSSLFGERTTAEDGLPLPPAPMRAQVGPLHASARFFLDSGRHNAELVRELVPLDEVGALLDWGCGCGRVLRHWAGLQETRVRGCDINPRMVAWCNENLPFAEASVNELTPPLPYDDDTFGLVYAFSVMTHLPEELQRTWVAECHRVLKPGGHFVFSTLGDYFVARDRLTADEQRAFENGELVVLYEDAPGTSLCSAYHPREWVAHELAQGFDVVGFRSAADDGHHDIHVLRKQP
jgi:SAM-dependent methyltransferase